MDEPNRGSRSEQPNRKRGLGRILKRFKSALSSSSNKATKRDTSDVAEHTSGGRHLESAASFVTTTTIRTRTPDNRNRTPEPRSPSAAGRRTPSLRVLTPDIPDVPPIPEDIPPVPRDPRIRPPSRPLLLEPSVSEGDLVARPIRELIPDSEDALARRPEASLERSNSNLLPRSDPRDQRSIALFQRYGIHLEPGDWSPANRPATMERVDKAIRMRVHYHCHKCEVALGPSKICIACGHKKCRKCIRFPVRRHRHGDHADDDEHHHHDHEHDCSHQHHAGAAPEMSQITQMPPPMRPESPPKHSYESQTSWATSSDVDDVQPPSIPARPQTGVASSVIPFSTLPAMDKKQSRRLAIILREIQTTHYKPVNAIHVERLCHLCRTTFIRYERECHNCNHQLCNKCPRDPPKPPSDSANGGLPQRSPTPSSSMALDSPPQPPIRKERMWKKPRRRVRWTCDHCQGLFVEKEKTCPRCGHERCETCIREPPAIKVIEPLRTLPSEPAVLQSVETRLATFTIIDAGAASKALATVTMPRTTPSPPITLPSAPTTLPRAASPLLDEHHQFLIPAE